MASPDTSSPHLDWPAEGRARHAARLRAWRAGDAAIARGAEAYERVRHLPRLVRVTQAEIDDQSIAGAQRICARLKRALAAARRAAATGHWAYDLNRHLALAQALAAETKRLRRRRVGRRRKNEDRPAEPAG